MNHVLDAIQSVAAFERRESTPSDLLDTCLKRIDRFDSTINAFNALCPREVLALEAAQAGRRYARGAPRSPLDGIPFAVKANIAIRDCPWHAGIGALAHRIAIDDAEAVSALRRAGMIPIGILNMHEAALGVTTNNPHFGRTRNPHNLGHIPGGSSGGSAAAVAAGMVPLALGTDDMGSVRLPSAFCGIVGYKPAFGTIPVEGLIELAPRLDHIGVHARSVRDVDAMMLLFGEGVPAPAPPLADWQLASLPMATHLRRAYDALIERLDCTSSLDWRHVDLPKWRRAGLLVCERDAARSFAEPLRTSPEGFSEAFRAMLEWARQAPAEKFERADAMIDEAGERLRTDLQGRLLLCPTAPFPAPRIDDGAPDDTPNLTLPANFAGVPSMSIPMPNAASQLPIGLQVTGLDGRQVRSSAASIYPGIAPIASL